MLTCAIISNGPTVPCWTPVCCNAIVSHCQGEWLPIQCLLCRQPGFALAGANSSLSPAHAVQKRIFQQCRWPKTETHHVHHGLRFPTEWRDLWWVLWMYSTGGPTFQYVRVQERRMHFTA